MYRPIKKLAAYEEQRPKYPRKTSCQKCMNGKKRNVVCIDNSNKTRHLGNHHSVGAWRKRSSIYLFGEGKQTTVHHHRNYILTMTISIILRIRSKQRYHGEKVSVGEVF